MTCHDARERLSAWVDDALDAPERALVDAHLSGCAECRAERDRLRATVSLLRAVEPAQAPAGLAARVLESVRAPAGSAARVLESGRPAPWHRRLVDRLAGIRVLRGPLEATAVVAVATLAIVVFVRSPALQRAARTDVPATVHPSAPVTTSAGEDTAGREARPAPRKIENLPAGSPLAGGGGESRGQRQAPNAVADAVRAARHPSAPPAPSHPSPEPGSDAGPQRGIDSRSRADVVPKEAQAVHERPSGAPGGTRDGRAAVDAQSRTPPDRTADGQTHVRSNVPPGPPAESRARARSDDGRSNSGVPPSEAHRLPPSGDGVGRALRDYPARDERAAGGPVPEQRREDADAAARAREAGRLARLPDGAGPVPPSGGVGEPGPQPSRDAATGLAQRPAPAPPPAAPAQSPAPASGLVPLRAPAPPSGSARGPDTEPETRSKSRADGPPAGPATPGDSGSVRVYPGAAQPSDGTSAAVRRSVLPLGPPPAAISGGLRVKDRPAAERELAELLTRTSGVQVARRVEAGATTVDIVVPRAAVAAFLAGLPRIGSWQPDTAGDDALPGSVPITIRIAD